MLAFPYYILYQTKTIKKLIYNKYFNILSILNRHINFILLNVTNYNDIMTTEDSEKLRKISLVGTIVTRKISSTIKRKREGFIGE